MFPYASLHPNAGALLKKEILLPFHLRDFDHGGDNYTDQNDDSTSTCTVSIPVQAHEEDTEENDAENGEENDQNLAENDAIFHEPEGDEMGAGHEEDLQPPRTPVRQASDHARWKS